MTPLQGAPAGAVMALPAVGAAQAGVWPRAAAE